MDVSASLADGEADLARLEERMTTLQSAAERASGAIASAFARGVAGGRSFEDVLRGLGERLIEIGLRAAFRPLESGLASFFRSLGSGFAQPGAGAPMPITPFADGGVIAAPALFPLGRGAGLMAERGAEAILPLARGPDGRLGVAAGEGGGRPVIVNVSIATEDAASFRRSEGRVAGAIARAVAHGQRML
jgi:phage-related minor tail protein